MGLQHTVKIRQLKYRTVKQALIQDIANGRYGGATPVPSERELSARLDAAPMTIRRAMQELVDEGLLVRQRGRGKGTYVREQSERTPLGAVNSTPLKRLAVIHSDNWDALRRDPVFYFTFLEVQAECAKRGVSMNFLPAHDSVGKRLESRVAELDCQALMVLDWSNPEELVQAQSSGMPVVVAGPFQETTVLSFVAPNDYQGAFSVVRYLQELGHSTVALINSRKEYKVTVDRREGWRAALAPSALDFERLHYPVGRTGVGQSFTEVQAELKTEFQRRRPPSAIFARDGFFAHAAILALNELGLRTPHDVSVACVGGFYEGIPGVPTITKAVAEPGVLGRTLIQLVGDLVSGRQPTPVGMLLPLFVQDGETTIRKL